MSIIGKIFGKSSEDEVRRRIANAIQAFQKTDMELREQSKRNAETISLSRYVDKPVICLSSDITNPVIGFGKKIEFVSAAQNPMLVVQDYVTNDELLVFSSIFTYNEQRYNVLINKLTPEERACLIARDRDFSDLNKGHDHELILTPEEIYEQLTNNGFFKKLGETK